MGSRKSVGQISEADFESLLQTLSATSKGRSFLEEYRRRCQPADTLGLLDSMKRIESTMQGVRSRLQPERIADELRHVGMSLDIALEEIEADPEGDETARRFALVARARREIETLRQTLAGPESDGA